jgi:hypothetical protein
MIHGSFWVIHHSTRSPSRPATAAAYPVKASTVDRPAQPPSAISASGMSQWFSVRTGVTPRSSSASTNRS